LGAGAINTSCKGGTTGPIGALAAPGTGSDYEPSVKRRDFNLGG
jgi:hypothetical protein